MQLPVVGDARVRAQVRLQVDHPLERALGGRVAAELDLGVGDLGIRAHALGNPPARLGAEAELLAEVVAQARERGGPEQGVDVAGISPQRGVEAPLRARVIAGIAILARLLEVVVAE